MADESYDPIAETQQRARDLQEERMPTGVSTTAAPHDPIGYAIQRGRAIEQARFGAAAQSYAQAPRGVADINQDRDYLAQQLGNYNPRSRESSSIVAQLHNLDREQQGIEFEANQRRIMAHTNAIESNRQLSIDRSTEIDEQGHAMLQTMGKLDAMLRNGRIDKGTYDDALLEAGAQYPLAMRHPEAARHFEFAINEADKQNDYLARREFTQAAKIGAKYGITPQINPETGLPSIEHTRQAALQTDKGKQEVIGGLNRELAQKYGIPTGVASIFNPIQPHASEDKGQTINLPFLDQKTGGVSTLKVPTPLFEQVKADLGPRYFAVGPPTQTAGAISGPPQPAAPAAPQIPTVGSAADYQALPPGSTFISGGKRYQKPAEQK